MKPSIKNGACHHPGREFARPWKEVKHSNVPALLTPADPIEKSYCIPFLIELDRSIGGVSSRLSVYILSFSSADKEKNVNLHSHMPASAGFRGGNSRKSRWISQGSR